MGYLKSIGTVIIYIGLFLAVITFLPGLPPHAEYSEYNIKVPHERVIKSQLLELKGRLQGAEVLFPGEIKGAECFASYNGEIYTGVRGGYVVKLEENRIEPIVKFGQKCDGLWQEEKCGRPLGLKFNDKGELFVADAYYGIFKVNVKTRQYVNIVNSSKPIDGRVPKIVNSLDIAKNGDIYWTDSSTDFGIHDGIYTFLANPSGRLIRYNAATKKNQVLVKNLGFANGVLLNDDESFVIALECLTSRVVKYHLKGPKAGQHEILVDALPGLPDNVHTDGQGGFLISLIISIDSEHPFLPHSLIPHPYIRKMLSRLLYSIEGPFKVLQDIYPNYYAETFIHAVGSFEALKVVDVKKTSIVLRIDKAGTILDALYSPDKKVYDICSAYIHNGYLWLGSPWNEYIMRVPLKQAFPDLAAISNYNKRSSNEKVQNKDEPLLTVSEMPNNIKVEVKSTNAKSSQETNTKLRSTSTDKEERTTQKFNSDATTTKSTTQKPTTTTTTSTTTTATTTTTTTTTTTPKPTTASPPAASKTLTKETNKKKDTVKTAEKDNVKEIKIDNSNSQANTKTLKKDNEPAATAKSKSDESLKKDARESQPTKSKPVENKDDSVNK